MKKHLLDGVKKGAFDDAEAEKRFNKWIDERDSKLDAKADTLAKEKEKIQKAKLEEEAKVNAARAEKLAKRNAEAQAEEAKEEAVAEAEETQAEEAQVEEKTEE